MNPLVQQKIDAFLVEMREHLDAIQVLACVENDDGSTASISRGSGLWHARVNLAQDFVHSDQARDAAIYLADAIESNNDE